MALGESFVDVALRGTAAANSSSAVGRRDKILQDTFETASQQLETGFPMCLNCTEELRATLK